MKIPFSVGLGAGASVVALVGIAALAYWLSKNTEKFNPASDQNLAYKGANTVAASITGFQDETVGTAIAGAVDSVAVWLGLRTPVTASSGYVTVGTGSGGSAPAPDTNASDLAPYIGGGA